MIVIYGKKDCASCRAVAAAFGPRAESRNVLRIWDDFPAARAERLITATGGRLPVVVVRGAAGEVVTLGAAEEAASAPRAKKCEHGECEI